MDDAGRELLLRVEALMLEVRTELRVSRDSRETSDELDRLRKDAADLAGLRKRAADRRKRNRTERESRDSAATNDKPAESHDTMSRDSPATVQVVKALSSSQDLDQEQELKNLQRPATVARQPAEKVAVGEVKRSYSEAYFAKYRVAPAWNATVAGQFKHLVQRLGVEKAAAVAAFYVTHPDQQYIRNRHPVSLLLRDYERLSTDWARGDQITGIGARLEERTNHTANVFTDLLKSKGA